MQSLPNEQPKLCYHSQDPNAPGPTSLDHVALQNLPYGARSSRHGLPMDAGSQLPKLAFLWAPLHLG